MEFVAPKTLPVQIVERAEPPQTPVGPNRTLGAVLFALVCCRYWVEFFCLNHPTNPSFYFQLFTGSPTPMPCLRQ